MHNLTSMQRRWLYGRRRVCVWSMWRHCTVWRHTGGYWDITVMCQWTASESMIDRRRWKHMHCRCVAASTQPARWHTQHWTIGVLQVILDRIKVLRVEDLFATTTTELCGAITHICQSDQRLRRQNIGSVLWQWWRVMVIKVITMYTVIINIMLHLYTG